MDCECLTRMAWRLKKDAPLHAHPWCLMSAELLGMVAFVEMHVCVCACADLPMSLGSLTFDWSHFKERL